MNLLVVEDDENKKQQISQFLCEALPNANLILERSLQSGLRCVRSSQLDLIILDMTLPNYDASPEEPGGQTHIFGGREFLRQMDRFDIVIPVIVVTQFETFGKPPARIGLRELDQELRAEHENVYKGAVYYHAAIDGWKSELKRLIDMLMAKGS